MNILTRWFRDAVSKSGIERRESARAAYSGPIQLRTSLGVTYRGFGCNLSTYGMGAVVYADLQVGDSVVLYYTHPNGAANKFACRHGVVRWRKGNRYGFEFEHSLTS